MDQNQTTSRGKILIADDEAANRQLLSSVLQFEGYEVVEAEDGKETLERIAETNFDVILLDVMMPYFTGYEVCERLQDDPKTEHIPVLMVTALESRSECLHAMEVGGSDFITKPVDTRYLRLRVRNAVHRKQLGDRVRAQFAQLQELEEKRDELVQMVVHDMRSPLGTIGGFAELLHLTHEEELSESGREFLSLIQHEVKSLEGMVSDILDVSRSEDSTLPLDRDSCDLHRLLLDTAASFPKLTGHPPIDVEVNTPNTVANCDGTLIRRVLENLTGNALKFTPAEGRIVINLEAPDEKHLRVTVRDTGSGIPAEALGGIFDKFSQAPGAKGKVKRSSGLGLAFCKMAVEAHGGNVGVVSEMGRGSIFWFDLPAGEAVLLAA